MRIIVRGKISSVPQSSGEGGVFPDRKKKGLYMKHNPRSKQTDTYRKPTAITELYETSILRDAYKQEGCSALPVVSPGLRGCILINQDWNYGG